MYKERESGSGLSAYSCQKLHEKQYLLMKHWEECQQTWEGKGLLLAGTFIRNKKQKLFQYPEAFWFWEAF